jgi:hypothetical protein
MNRQVTKTVLITGPTRGIGYELAHLFARDGYDLVLVSRSEGELKQVAGELETQYGVQATVLAKDLARPEAPGEIHAALQEENIRVDALVNNAGFGLYGRFVETDLETELDMIRVNVAALTYLTKLFLPGMVERGQGHVLNLASLAAFEPGPLMSVYHATKAYVLYFSEAIARELDDSGVTVTALCPGPTRTSFEERAGTEGTRAFRWGATDAQTVAEAGYRGLMQGKTVVVPGAVNKLATLLVRLGPRNVVTAVTEWVQRK